MRTGLKAMMPVVLGISVAAAAQKQPAPDPAAARTAQDQKPICKRWAPIGSLVPTKKECHTRAEWQQLADNGRDQAQGEGDRRVTVGSFSQ